MTVRIVTDSTAHLWPEVVQELNIVIVPHHIRIGDREYLDGVDLDEEGFYHRVYEHGLEADTAPPTVEDFYRTYDKLGKVAGEILSIHLSEALSPTTKNARRAADILLGRCDFVLAFADFFGYSQPNSVRSSTGTKRDHQYAIARLCNIQDGG